MTHGRCRTAWWTRRSRTAAIPGISSPPITPSGTQLQKDAASFVTAANGKVLGEACWRRFRAPRVISLSFLVQAKWPAALHVLGLANGGGDTVNCIKQASEFGLMKGGMKVAGLIFIIHDVHGVGLESAQGSAKLTEPFFYWNMNGWDAGSSRNGSRRRWPVTRPGSVHAGSVFRVTHYLKAVVELGYDKAKASGRTVDAMK